jgi:hypothetical protein
MKKLLFIAIFLFACSNNPILQTTNIYENTNWRISSIKIVQTKLSISGKQVLETNISDSSGIANYNYGKSVYDFDTTYGRPIYGLQFKSENTVNVFLSNTDSATPFIYHVNEILHQMKIMFINDTNISGTYPFKKNNENQFELTLPAVLAFYYKDSAASWFSYRFNNDSQQDSNINLIEGAYSTGGYDSVKYQIHTWTYNKR